MHPLILLPLCILGVFAVAGTVFGAGWCIVTAANFIYDRLRDRGLGSGTSELVTTLFIISILIGFFIWLALVSH